MIKRVRVIIGSDSRCSANAQTPNCAHAKPTVNDLGGTIYVYRRIPNLSTNSLQRTYIGHYSFYHIQELRVLVAAELGNREDPAGRESKDTAF